MQIHLKKIFLTVSLLLSNNVNSEITVFENDFSQWSDMVGSSSNLIDFESIVATSPVKIIGNEFSGNPLSPIFSIIQGGGLFVGNPSTGQILTPTSGDNMLFPECTPSCEGIVRMTFNKEITSFGAFFIDVEADFATTGFSLNPSSPTPEVSFSSFQGQNNQSFLGFISDTPFNSVDIHFTTGENIDGTLIDDVVYASEIVIIKKPEISISGGYIRLDTTKGFLPPDYDCLLDIHHGRMVFDEANEDLYICSESGWIVK